MKQTKALLSLRANQCYRYLNETGFGIIVVALFILTGVIFNALQNIMTASSFWAPVVAFFTLFFIEIKREDTFFLKSIFESKNELLGYKVIENLIIVSPILIFQSIFSNWGIIQSIVLISSVMVFLPLHLIKTHEKERKRDIKFIPLSIFEVKFYFEKNTWSLLFLWILLFLGGLHISLWILGMVFLCGLPIDIYTPSESREMVNYHPFYVRKKIIDSLGYLLLFIVPPTITTWIFSPSYVLVLLYGIVAFILGLILSISKKYMSYYGVRQKVISTKSTVILTFLMLAPGGILITLSACIYYYFKAEKHMKNEYAII